MHALLQPGAAVSRLPVVLGDGGEEDDQLDAVETVDPLGSLVLLAADVHDSKLDLLSPVGNVENVFDDACEASKSYREIA